MNTNPREIRPIFVNSRADQYMSNERNEENSVSLDLFNDQEEPMYKTKKYYPSDKMSDMICSDYALLQVMSRFGLSLGFGEATIEEVCKANQVDCKTFLAVANYMLQKDDYVYNEQEQISIPTLMNYLKQSHHFFLDFQLPNIREKLLVYINKSEDPEISQLILNFFDSYVDEVFHHMGFEDTEIFTYVNDLLHGKRNPEYSIDSFANKHGQTDQKLTELKNIIIKYLPTNGETYLSNALLFELFSCIEDLNTHGHIEDFIFVPVVRRLEQETLH